LQAPKHEYDIIRYRSELASEVTELLSDFWGGDPEVNRAYLRWKYEDNPYTDRPLAFVAVHGGKVKGFRGYFALRWHIPQTDFRIVVLSPGDTFVHPDHRRTGLSVAMGKTAMKAYEREYKVFLNLSATESSVPGYLKMGFVPLVPKIYLNQYTFRGLMRFVLARKTQSWAPQREIRLGEFGSVVVSDQPRPEEMAQIVSRQQWDRPRLAPFKDEVFFQWRFNNKLKKYMFYYCSKEHTTAAYMVVRLSPNGHRGYIIDEAFCDERAMESMLRVALEHKHFDVFSIYDLRLDKDIVQSLKGLGFRAGGLMRLFEKRTRGEWPLLVRPVKQEYSEDDWFVKGMDVRQAENWHIREICSDNV